MDKTYSIDRQYRQITNRFPNHEERPIVGITGNCDDVTYSLNRDYAASVAAAGMVPVILPPTTSYDIILSYLDSVDALLFSGGSDINPLYQNEEPIPELHAINPLRDHFELLLARLAYDRQIPMLGICRGIQVIATSLGGTVCQDIQAENPDTKFLKHSQEAPRPTATHTVKAEENTLVARLLGEEFSVNSFHHQAVRDAGPHLRVSAVASDGVIEAVESNEFKSILAVQWHPESFVRKNNNFMYPLFNWLSQEATSFRQAKHIHQSFITLDSHCDTPMLFAEGYNPSVRQDHACVDLHKMTEGYLDAAFWAVYLPQKELTPEGRAGAVAYANGLIECIKKTVSYARGAQLAFTAKDLPRIKRNGDKAIYIGIENGYAIGTDLSHIERYRREGVVYMTLCHNGDNDLCDSAMRSLHTHGGLSALGRDAVRELNRCGIMVDLSHTSETTFYDVLSLTDVPVICSHSSCRALCNHPRNLSDDQLRSLAEQGGVVQITFYPGFVRSEGQATIHDIVAHILHAIDVCGINHVGIGSDFDGDGGVLGLSNTAEMINLTRLLLAEGLTPYELRKLWGGNFLHVMEQVQRRANIYIERPRYAD
ncbi:MAG: membrane dipeptidase [Alloprevotella sp.]|nr:membrane dipeptidase [Alloprevotella sp.]